MSGAALADGAHQFVFTAYSDAAGGADVVAGSYRAALQKLKGGPEAMRLDSPAVDTNRCVAYSMTLQWREARMACDAAVHAASEHRNLPPAWWSSMPVSDEESVAVAYANRAVMYWMLNDDAAARKDLAAAQELSPQSDFVARNLIALEAHAEVAQAGRPVPKS